MQLMARIRVIALSRQPLRDRLKTQHRRSRSKTTRDLNHLTRDNTLHVKILKFDKKIVHLSSILEAQYYFRFKGKLEVTEQSDCYEAIYSDPGPSSSIDGADFEQIFTEKVLEIALRHIIAERTKVEREMIIGKALFGTCLRLGEEDDGNTPFTEGTPERQEP